MSKIIGVDKPQLIGGSFKGVTPSYIGVALTNYDINTVRENFKEWLNTPHEKEYLNVELLKPETVLVRLYRYEKQLALLGTDKNPIYETLIIPVCKVLVSNSETIKVGDVLYCNDEIAKIATNPNWLQWNKMMENERPVPEGIPEPDREVGLILEWRKMSKFVLDKLNPSLDDSYTFIRNSYEFTSKPKNNFPDFLNFKSSNSDEI